MCVFVCTECLGVRLYWYARVSVPPPPPSQLPVYVPSEAERKDPALYANNMREYMVRGRGQQAGREEGTRGPVAGLAAARESKSVRFAPEQRVVTPR